MSNLNRRRTVLFVCALLAMAAGIFVQARLLGEVGLPILHAASVESPGAPPEREGAAAIPTDAAGTAADDGCPSEHDAEGARVDINRATAEELMQLPGIGPAYAQRIIELRLLRGGFRYKEELMDVSGIGPARFAKLAPLVEVGPYGDVNEPESP